MKVSIALLSSFAAVVGGALMGSDAHACGGCFHQEQPPQPQTEQAVSVVMAHRMAVSISTDQTVLWDQVQYAGSPDEFAWVLPVRPGARVELGTDAWFETLDTVTSVRVQSPTIQCLDNSQDVGDMETFRCQMSPMAAAGCSADGDLGGGEEGIGLIDIAPEPEPVEVVHHGSVGPYETVTLRSEIPNALTEWLIERGYAVGEEMEPIIDAYVAEGFDFIALRLLPDAGVQQMRPVRVVQPGAVPTLPLRMVAAGTGATVGMTLFVIGEGRWRVENFAEAAFPTQLSWDFSVSQSDYALLRQQNLAQQSGSSWMTTYSKPGALFRPQSGFDNQTASYVVAGQSVTTIADAYFRQAELNGESGGACLFDAASYAFSVEKVIDPCAAGLSPHEVRPEDRPPSSSGGQASPSEERPRGEPPQPVCTDPGLGEISMAEFACGDADDLAAAMVGLRPGDVWVTRLEADLPRGALGTDLALGAGTGQNAVHNYRVASGYTNPPCQVATVASLESAREQRPTKVPAAAIFGLLIAAGAIARRLRRLNN